MYYLLTNLLMRCYYILKENKDGLLRIAGLPGGLKRGPKGPKGPKKALK